VEVRSRERQCAVRTFTGSPRRAERGPEGGTDHADTVVDLVTPVAAGECARASGDDQERNLWYPNDLRNPRLEGGHDRGCAPAK